MAALMLVLQMQPMGSFAQGQSSVDKATIEERDSRGEKKAVVAKDELWKKLSSDPSVIGVGLGSSHSQPVIYVYVTPQAPKQTLDRIPKKCRGILVSVIKSEPLSAH